MRPCERCKGTKTIHFDGFTTAEGKVYPDYDRECHACHGTGEFPEINEADLRARILATKGKNKGKIRASMVSDFNDLSAGRAYYIWRLARFHGGKDMTMPMTADTIVHGDPYKKELDALAEAVAKEQFGSDMRAALRWGRAFGII